MSRIETPDRPEALTAIIAIALFIPLLAGVYTSCDKKKGNTVTVEQQSPPPNPVPTPTPQPPNPTPTPNPNPGTLQNQWISLNNVNPPTPRANHSAIWTGTRMIVWGGQDAASTKGDGAALDPVSGNWTTLGTGGAPSPRYGHKAAWDGSKMFIWGGTNGTTYFDDGFTYDPATNAWAPVVFEDQVLAGRSGHSLVYNGQTFLMWGGSSPAKPTGYIDGGYYLLNGFWSTLSGTAPILARINHSAVWTGSRMIMFGGQNQGVTSQDGFIFDPNTNIFSQMLVAPNTPANRSSHSAVWTGSQMLIWGGLLQGITTSYYADGRIYDYVSTNWTIMSTTGAPTARAGHTAVWAGDAMIIWGGTSGPATYLNNGAVFH